MKKLAGLLILVLIHQGVVAQSEEESLHRLFKLELGFQGVGLAYEMPLAKQWTIDLSGGLGGGYYLLNGIHYQWILNDPVVYFKSEVKFLYNRSKRLRQGKSLRNNAGNYLAFQTKYTTERVLSSHPFEQLRDPLNNTLLNEIHWGFQRPLGRRFLFNFHLGLGVAVDYDFANSCLYPGLGLKFSHILIKQ